MKWNLFLVVCSLMASLFVSTPVEARSHGKVVFKMRYSWRSYSNGCCECSRVRVKIKVRWRMRGGHAVGFHPCYAALPVTQGCGRPTPINPRSGSVQRPVNPVNLFRFPGQTHQII